MKNTIRKALAGFGLEEAQRAAINAREYVMATEAKLYLIEAAIQVLGTRTRDSALTRS